MLPPGHWDWKGKQGRGLEKERKRREWRSNARAQIRQPKSRQIRKPVQDSKSEPAELTSKTPGMEKKKTLKMPHFLTEAQLKAPDTEMHKLKLKCASARQEGLQRRKLNHPPFLPNPCLEAWNGATLPRPHGIQGNFNRVTSADGVCQSKAPAPPFKPPRNQGWVLHSTKTCLFWENSREGQTVQYFTSPLRYSLC